MGFWFRERFFKMVVFLHMLQLQNFKTKRKYIEDITPWREDMNYIFEWQNNILRTSAASE